MGMEIINRRILWVLPANKSKSTRIWDRQSCRLNFPTNLTWSCLLIWRCRWRWRRHEAAAVAVAVDRDYWIMDGGTTMCHVCLCHRKKVHGPWLERVITEKRAQRSNMVRISKYRSEWWASAKPQQGYTKRQWVFSGSSCSFKKYTSKIVFILVQSAANQNEPLPQICCQLTSRSLPDLNKGPGLWTTPSPHMCGIFDAHACVTCCVRRTKEEDGREGDPDLEPRDDNVEHRRHLPLAPVPDIKRFSHLIGRKIKSELIKTLEWQHQQQQQQQSQPPELLLASSWLVSPPPGPRTTKKSKHKQSFSVFIFPADAWHVAGVFLLQFRASSIRRKSVAIPGPSRALIAGGRRNCPDLSSTFYFAKFIKFNFRLKMKQGQSGRSTIEGIGRDKGINFSALPSNGASIKRTLYQPLPAGYTNTLIHIQLGFIQELINSRMGSFHLHSFPFWPSSKSIRFPAIYYWPKRRVLRMAEASIIAF